MSRKLIGTINISNNIKLQWINSNYIDLFVIYDQSVADDVLIYIELTTLEFSLLQHFLQLGIERGEFLQESQSLKLTELSCGSVKVIQKQNNTEVRNITLNVEEILYLIDLKFRDIYLKNLDNFQVTIAKQRIDQVRKIIVNARLLTSIYQR